MCLLTRLWKSQLQENKTLSKILYITFVLFELILLIQIYLMFHYKSSLPLTIIFTDILNLLIIFMISIFYFINLIKLEKSRLNLESEKQYNKTLQASYDNIRTFKHDFSNIIASIGGYIETDDLAGLKVYYKQLFQDCKQLNNLSTLNPNLINNPAVYSILANKYYKAESLGIKINLECFINFNNLHMKIYEFTRILGILVDNAIEASSECKNKRINIIMRTEPKRKRDLLFIENTYSNKNIDINQIYNKGYSTKPNNTGLGLWEVNNIIKKHKNLARFTSKNEKFFKQQIEIYFE